MSTLGAKTVNLYLKSRNKLDQYSLIRLNSLEIIVESSLNWIERDLGNIIKNHSNYDKSSLNEILLDCQKLSSKIRSSAPNHSSQNHLLLASQLLKQKSKVWYLDEIWQLPYACELILPIVAQILLEKSSQLTSRLALVRDKKNIQHLVVFVKLMDQSELLCFAVTEGRMSPISINDLTLDEDHFSIENIQNDSSIAKSGSKLSLIGYTGKKLDFTLSGRSPTDKRYETDEKRIQSALSSELVPIEIYFHPYYRAFGHTTIRVGKTMYELSTHGWRAHGAPQSSARIFLFNNPFFKTQLENNRHLGMAAFSIGKTILLPKNQVELIQISLQNLCSLKGFKKQSFNLVTNNCNQGILRILNKCGISDLRTNGYYGFSSILSFRRFLFNLSFEGEQLHIYPMPGVDLTIQKIRDEFPKWIYRHNSIQRELKRALPIYAVDLARLPILWVKRKWNTTLMPQLRNFTPILQSQLIWKSTQNNLSTNQPNSKKQTTNLIH